MGDIGTFISPLILTGLGAILFVPDHWTSVRKHDR